MAMGIPADGRMAYGGRGIRAVPCVVAITGGGLGCGRRVFPVQ